MMLRNGRHIRAFLIMTLGLALIAGCGGSDASEGSTTEATEPAETTEATAPTETTQGELEPVTISYLASQNWVLDSEQELAEQFEAETGILFGQRYIMSGITIGAVKG